MLVEKSSLKMKMEITQKDSIIRLKSIFLRANTKVFIIKLKFKHLTAREVKTFFI